MFDPSWYLIGTNRVSNTDPHLQQILARAYEDPIRPRCLCVPGGVEMYIAKYGLFMVKRMPGSGKEHAAACDSYEPEPGSSGLGFHLGEAVIAKGSDLLEVRSGFALDRFEGRTIARGEPGEATSVSSKHRLLSILGMFHLIWDKAQFNRWSPAMRDKRNQSVIRKYALEAAEKIELKGIRLSERLYVPEQFRKEDAEAIKNRRDKALAVMNVDAHSARHKLMFVIGEIKTLTEVTLGYKLLIKHMPDCPLLLDSKSGSKILKQFGNLFQIHDMQEGVKLMAVLTMAMKGFGDFRVDTMSVAMTTDTWIPIDDTYEKAVADALTAANRRFIKQLSFDAPSSVAFSNFLLLDAGREPVSLNIVSPNASKTERRAKEDLIARLPPDSWIWRPEEEGITMPPLPAKQPSESARNPPQNRRSSAGDTPAQGEELSVADPLTT